MNHFFHFLLVFIFFFSNGSIQPDRGEVSSWKNKFIWSGTGQAFVPNYIMIDVMANQREKGSDNDLSCITPEKIDDFLDVFFEGHGFNGVHIPVYGQWFHIGENEISESDSLIDQRTFDKLKMIIGKVYRAGGCTHLWLWGDDSRDQTSASLKDGIMGRQEQKLLDEIHRQLGPLKGWTMGYGFDLWEWVNEEQLKMWHDYLWQKPGWNHLLGARASKNKLDQIYEGLDYSGYEYHKPWFNDLVKMINKRPEKPSFSEDRYRIRTPSKYPEKDYTEEETLRGLWHHTMAGGVAAIWGNLDGTGEYKNKDALKCFSVFWNKKNRFGKEMIPDTMHSDGFCLKDTDRRMVFYKENAAVMQYRVSDNFKKAVAVDTRKKYKELDLGHKTAGTYEFSAPYVSDWVLVVE